MIKNVKTSAGKVLSTTTVRRKKEAVLPFQYKYKLKVGEQVKVNGTPFCYIGNGYIAGNTKLKA